jgi:O-antigen ligase
MRPPVTNQANSFLLSLPQKGLYNDIWRRRLKKQTASIRCAWSLSSWFALFFAAVIMIPVLTASGYNILKMVFGSLFLWGLFMLLKKQTSMNKVLFMLERRKVENLALLCWLLLVFLSALGGRGLAGAFQADIMMFMVLFMIMSWAYSTMRPELLNGLQVAIIVMLGAQAAISLPLLYATPQIARMVMEAKDNAVQASAVMSGVGEYSLYAALAISLPIMLAFALSLTGIKRILTFASSAAVLASILLSTFTGASSLAVTGLIMMAFALTAYSRERSVKKFFYVVFLVGLLSGAIYFVSDTKQFGFVFQKASVITGDSLKEGVVEGDYSLRGYLALQSFLTFCDNPFFGIGPYTGAINSFVLTGGHFGGHSSWIDGLAEYGLFGFGLYLLFLGAIFVQLYREFKSNRRDLFAQARLISFILFIIGGTINPVIYNKQIIFLFYFFCLTRPFTQVARKPYLPAKL